MSDHSLRHRVKRTRKKDSGAVFRDNTIVIRLARGLSKTEEREHVDDLLERMTRQVIEERTKHILDPFRPLLSGGQSVSITLAAGRRYTFALFPGTRNSVRRMRGGFRVTIAPHVRPLRPRSALWNIPALGEQPAGQPDLREINERTYGIRISRVRLAFASSQWGSCSPRGGVMLNAALLFTPPGVLKYVTVHELAHRKIPNHSPLYWEWVRWAMPRYKVAKKILDEYRLPS